MERHILKSEIEVENYLKSFNTKVYALDTETLQDYATLVGISLCDGFSACYIPNPSEETLCLLKKSLSLHCGKGSIVIGHNLVFDFRVLARVGFNFYNAEWFDTMVAQHLIDEEEELGLKFLTKKYFPEKEVVRYEDAIAKGINSIDFYNYAIDDAINSFCLAEIMKNKLQADELVNLFKKLEMPFLRALLHMEQVGVLIDMEQVKATTKELKKAIFDMEIEMLNILGKKYSLQANLTNGEFEIDSPVNFRSSSQLQKIIIEELGLEIESKTKKGNVSVGKATINKLKNEHKFMEVLNKFKIATKLLNAFFEPMEEYVGRDGRVHCKFNDVGTVTGRLSCSNPNLQQLPKVNDSFPVDTRKCFIASPGKKMIAIDYSQQELRIMAHLSKDERLIKIILDSGDIHLINANNVFNLGIPEEKLFINHPEYEMIKKEFKKYRDMGKTFSFGIAYGMGIHKLSRDFKVSLEEAQVLLDNFFAGFPRLKEAIALCHNQAKEKLWVKTSVGRKRRFKYNQWNKLDEKSLRQSFNFLIQSFGADIMRKACIRIMNYKTLNPQYELNLLMSIHDEVVVECKEEFAEKVKEDLCELMRGCANLVVPLEVEAHIGNNYSEVK